MSSRREKILKGIIDVMEEANAGTEIETARWDVINPQSCLYGEGAPFDSIDFVRFLMLVEQKIFDLTETRVTLMNEKAFSKKYNPFKNADCLADYIVETLSELDE